MYIIIEVSGVRHSDSRFLKVMFHLQLLQLQLFSESNIHVFQSTFLKTAALKDVLSGFPAGWEPMQNIPPVELSLVPAYVWPTTRDCYNIGYIPRVVQYVLEVYFICSSLYLLILSSYLALFHAIRFYAIILYCVHIYSYVYIMHIICKTWQDINIYIFLIRSYLVCIFLAYCLPHNIFSINVH